MLFQVVFCDNYPFPYFWQMLHSLLYYSKMLKLIWSEKMVYGEHGILTFLSGSRGGSRSGIKPDGIRLVGSSPSFCTRNPWKIRRFGTLPKNECKQSVNILGNVNNYSLSKLKKLSLRKSKPNAYSFFRNWDKKRIEIQIRRFVNTRRLFCAKSCGRIIYI